MFSSAKQAWILAAGAFSNEHEKYRRKQQYKSAWHAFVFPLFAAKWFNILNSSALKSVTQYRSRLYLKPFRIYMSTKWSKGRRVKVILDTYSFISDLGENFLLCVLDDGRFPIATFHLKDGAEATISIGYDERYRKEGELVFFFDCEHLGGFIFGASFCFENTPEKGWVCRIGCVQGTKNENIVNAAQDFAHGLRPKSLMVFVIQEFCKCLNIHTLYGVGQSIQAFRRKHAIHIQCLHKIHFNYNQLWTESGGEQGKDGWFLLPVLVHKKRMEEIKTNKRAMYRRRYMMMDNIARQISESVHLLTASTVKDEWSAVL